MTDTELRRRIVALELAVDRLTVELSELKARPQQTYHLGGAGGNYFPWGTQTRLTHVVPSADGTRMRIKVTGDNVSRETSPGANGAEGPKSLGKNPVTAREPRQSML
jgi:hypothetical protein